MIANEVIPQTWIIYFNNRNIKITSIQNIAFPRIPRYIPTFLPGRNTGTTTLRADKQLVNRL